MTTLDALMARFGAARFVKIDAEGAEPAILRGLSTPVPALSFEYLPGSLGQVEVCLERLSALGLTKDRANPSLLTLRAPIAGIVVSRDAVIGQPVTADRVLCEIVDLSEVWFLGRVFEKDLGRLKLDAAA